MSAGKINSAPVTEALSGKDLFLLGVLRRRLVISLDAEAGTIEVSLEASELPARRAAWPTRRHDYQSGALWRYFLSGLSSRRRVPGE